MKKNNEFLKYFKTFGIFVLVGGAGAGLGIGGTKLTFDLIDSHHKNKTAGLPLTKPGAHIKEGTHRVVITDNFWQAIINETEEAKQLVLNGVSKAYEDLNKLNTKLNFELCTTEDALEKYNIKKIDELKGDEIMLNVTQDIINNNKLVSAITDWKINVFTRELEDEVITYRKDHLMSAWRYYGLTKDEILSPYNSIAYTLTIHESMHAMGISHIEDKNSIMYNKASYYNKDISELDKEIIDKYNVIFYNTTPRYDEYKNLDEYNKKQEEIEKNKEELSLSM